MERAKLELMVGVFVLVGIACLGYLSIKLGKLEVIGGHNYPVEAEFTSASGLKPGASVEIAGVEVGRVEELEREVGVDRRRSVGERARRAVDTPGDEPLPVRAERDPERPHRNRRSGRAADHQRALAATIEALERRRREQIEIRDLRWQRLDGERRPADGIVVREPLGGRLADTSGDGTAAQQRVLRGSLRNFLSLRARLAPASKNLARTRTLRKTKRFADG